MAFCTTGVEFPKLLVQAFPQNALQAPVLTVSNQEVPRFCTSRHAAQCQRSSLTFAGFAVADVKMSCLACRTARPSTKSRLCHCFLAVSGANVLQLFTDMHRTTAALSCLVEILPQIGQVGLNDSGDDLQQCHDFVFRGRARLTSVAALAQSISKHFWFHATFGYITPRAWTSCASGRIS